MTVVVRDVRSVHVTNEQLLVLLGYVEQDLNDHTRQATAFGLLRVGGATGPRSTQGLLIISPVTECCHLAIGD